MINYTAPVAIMLVNIIIELLLIRSTVKYYHKRNVSRFNNTLFNMGRLLLIANTFAIITAFLDYFVYQSTTLDILQFGRFADRYAMMFSYMAMAEYED